MITRASENPILIDESLMDKLNSHITNKVNKVNYILDRTSKGQIPETKKNQKTDAGKKYSASDFVSVTGKPLRPEVTEKINTILNMPISDKDMFVIEKHLRDNYGVVRKGNK